MVENPATGNSGSQGLTNLFQKFKKTNNDYFIPGTTGPVTSPK